MSKREPAASVSEGIELTDAPRASGAAPGALMPSELAMADRLISIGMLAAGVAHELNNPLSYVLANLRVSAELVQDSESLSLSEINELRDALRDALEGAKRLRTIIRDLKTLSRHDDEGKAGVDLRRCVESALTMSWNEIRHRARLEKTFGDIPFVEANEGKMVQVFLNLLVNAAQAIEPGDVSRNLIRVTTGVENRQVFVRVSDSGPGIPEELRRRIFEPFFTTKDKVGTGLGLAICHDIIEKSGGRLEVDSVLGQGATFTVWLPVMMARSVK
jgi:two-component system, NtrC family, sensor kinase